MEEATDLTSFFKEVLLLCKVRKGEVLAVLTEGGERNSYARAYLAAAEELAAHAFQVNVAKQRPNSALPPRRTSLTGNRGAVEVLKTADIVIDLVGLLWSPEQNEIQKAGARILMS